MWSKDSEKSFTVQSRTWKSSQHERQQKKNAFVSTPTSNEMVAFSAPSLLSHTVTYPRAHDKQKTWISENDF